MVNLGQHMTNEENQNSNLSQENLNLSAEYEKIEIDSPICGRRFHIGYEVGGTIYNHVEVNCPHCGVLLFEKNYHPAAALMREENLVKAPDGSREIISECQFPHSSGIKP
jgi:DNA-directed RNA polymerase subunit RPC12/RpoP